MSTVNQTNTAQITILCTEQATSNVLVNRSFAPSLPAVNGVYGTYYVEATSGLLTLQFPMNVTIVYNLYIRNLAATGGGNVSLSLTINGGAAQTLILTPGDVVLYWSNQNALTTAGIGFTEVQVAASASAVPFEYFLGA